MQPTDEETQTNLLNQLDNEERTATQTPTPEATPEKPEEKPEAPEARQEGITEGNEAGTATPEQPEAKPEAPIKAAEATPEAPVTTATAEAKPETRGRKKLARDEAGNVVRPERPDRSQFKSLNDVVGSQQAQTPPNAPPTPQNAGNPPQQQKVDISQYISGALALVLIDLFFPAALVFGYNKFYATKYDKEPLKAGDLKLSAKEQKELEPLADAAIKEMMIELSPTKALIIALSVIYGGKMLMLTQDAE